MYKQTNNTQLILQQHFYNYAYTQSLPMHTGQF